MEIEVQYNKLLIEQGKLDPLGIWRVGDRLIGELLPPFTTVVGQRPARYFSMYCWILDQTIEKFAKDKQPLTFWRYFFELEAIFLCAIQLHKSHNYPDFHGMIGVEHAWRLINSHKDGQPYKFAKVKINNGWEVNYKNPMFSFDLVKNDYGIAGKINLTDKGKSLSDVYRKSISSTNYYAKYRGESEIPEKVLEELSGKCCPCLIHSPDTGMKAERDMAVDVLLAKRPDEDGSYLYSSIMLVLRCIEQTAVKGTFVPQSFMRASTTGLIDGKGRIFDPGPFVETYRKWRLYALDSLFTFSLESGLRGFLESLNMNKGRISVQSALSIVQSKELVNIRKKICQEVGIGELDIVKLYRNKSPVLGSYEECLIDKIKMNDTGPKMRILYSYLLYSYCQGMYEIFKGQDEFKEAISFYEHRAMHDSEEISLAHAYEDVKGRQDDYEIFRELFLGKWIIQRQLSIRSQRVKEVAWFTRSTDGFYEWEHEYEPGVYRASRLPNLLYFLLSINVVVHESPGWKINPEMKEKLKW
ncbi:MAG: hypothetical protein WAX69_04700 [Victivallales bacterium]